MKYLQCTGEQLKDHTYYVRIFSSDPDRFHIEKLGAELKGLGFEYKKGLTRRTNYFDKAFVTEEGMRRLNDSLYYARNLITFKFCIQKYARNDWYRSTFFEVNPFKEQYRCAYCGKKVKKDDLEIDHIFPVQKMMDSSNVRSQARMVGIYETNCLRNLAPSCRECNHKKGSHVGFWAIRGLIGKHELFWNMLSVSYVFLVLIGIIAIIAAFNADTLRDVLHIGNQYAFIR